MTDLKPCPFCGAKAELVIYDPEESWDYRMEIEHDESCWLASSRPSVRNYYTKAEAIEAWNTRTERTCKCVYRDCGDGFGGYYCTSCGEYMDASDRYCPNCGLKVVE